MSTIDTLHRIRNAVPDAREPFWQCFIECAKTNPAALRYVVILMALYMHLGPFSRKVIGEIDRRIAAHDDGARAPAMIPSAAPATL